VNNLHDLKEIDIQWFILFFSQNTEGGLLYKLHLIFLFFSNNKTNLCLKSTPYPIFLLLNRPIQEIYRPIDLFEEELENY
jgi:hypothetical protein